MCEKVPVGVGSRLELLNSFELEMEFLLLILALGTVAKEDCGCDKLEIGCWITDMPYLLMISNEHSHSHFLAALGNTKPICLNCIVCQK